MTIVEVRLAQANLYIKPINSYREINQPKYRKFATLRGKCTSFWNFEFLIQSMYTVVETMYSWKSMVELWYFV